MLRSSNVLRWVGSDLIERNPSYNLVHELWLSAATIDNR